MQDRSKDEPFPEFERIDALHTDYIRELSGLSKVCITIASATLALTLAPLAPSLLPKTGLGLLVFIWIALAATVLLGLVQILVFSISFKMGADYLFASVVTDSVFRLGAPDKKLDEAMATAHRCKSRFEECHRWSLRLVVLEFAGLFTAYVLLALFVLANLAAAGFRLN
ncbi:MAG TPA: hypothetical protein VMU45_03705 [Candidatus Eisenbacteria bacterium]|nr:hypothetical protein [Candidatus Eisenbacteria bacterium]